MTEAEIEVLDRAAAGPPPSERTVARYPAAVTKLGHLNHYRFGGAGVPDRDWVTV